MRQCQISYKSALFMMHRVRFALKPSTPEKFKGTVEVDGKTYCGGKPRYPGTLGRTKRLQRGTKKLRSSGIRRARRQGASPRYHRTVSAVTLQSAVRQMVDDKRG